MQQTDKHFFTLAAYKLHVLCVNKNFPVQPLPLIILPFGFEESYSAGRPLSRTYEHFALVCVRATRILSSINFL